MTADPSQPLPIRLKLLNWGKNDTVKGPVIVGPDTVTQLQANQARMGFDKIVIDFQHQTVPGSDSQKQLLANKIPTDPIPVAAYGVPLVVPGDGLYLDNIQWTEDGKKFARNYHDLSPTPQLDAKGEVIFLHSVALCRQGAVDGLSLYTSLFPLSTPTPTTPMQPADYRALLMSLLQKLGVTVPDQATDADIASAVDTFAAKPPVPPAKGAEPAAAPKDPNDPANKPAPAGATPMSAQAQLTELTTRIDSIEKGNLVALAASQGKVIPFSAEELPTIPLTTLKAVINRLPGGVVPLSSHNLGTLTPGQQPGGLTTLTAEEKQICKAMKISEKDYIAQKEKDTPSLRAQ